MKCSMKSMAVILLLVFGFTLVAAADVETLDLGASAPSFHLPGVDGKQYSLGDFSRAELLVVVFTCNHCPTAQAYEGRIKALAADYKDRGVALVAISPNDPKALRLDELGYTDLSDSFEEMKIRAREHQFNFPYLYDGETQEASKSYGPAATPHVFIFNQERKLRYVGRIDDAENPERVTTHDARNAIEALLEGKPVPVKETKTFGCSIKWADKRSSVKRAQERWAQEEVTLRKAGDAALKEVLRNNTENLRLINVWATWCGPCVAEFPELVAINRMYRNRHFELVTISADEPEKYKRALEFLEKQEASTTNYIFQSPDKYDLIELVDSEWAGNLPYTLLVKPGGEVMFRHAGIIDPLEVKQAIIEYLGRYYFSNQ